MKDKKKNSFFSSQKFLSGYTQVTDTVIISILFFLTSLPVITFGASASALYHTIIRDIREHGEKPIATYFKAFRNNFKQATILWLFCLLYIAVAGSGVLILLRMAQWTAGGLQLGIMIALALPLILLLPWIFIYQSRFNDSISTILKNASILTVCNLPTSVITGVIALLGLGLCILLPLALPFISAPCCLLISKKTEMVLAKISHG